MVKRLGLRGDLFMVACSGFYVHLQPDDHLIWFFLAVFGELLYMVFVKAVICVNCPPLPGGWHFFI